MVIFFLGVLLCFLCFTYIFSSSFSVHTSILCVGQSRSRYELSQLRHFFARLFGKSSSVPRVSFSLARGWARAPETMNLRVLGVDNGLVRYTVVNAGNGGRSGAQWLGRICETIIESVRARTRCREGRVSGMGIPRSVTLRIVALFDGSRRISFVWRRNGASRRWTDVFSRVMTNAFWIWY